ncbi:hypothetical protein [Peribacillus frigoritolerans]|uniref:hypothetical protein n=1 Tax=Peribacillus frigoritolerans TaxID=450367 RepID=UPI0020795944|nr:hypothetical protein [Peribacillus frigoritolerans]USK77834.1 hypothetical protein LIT31_26270 [Peribacillus frigoritolerans]USK77918.1 hypothetical protein LIT31_26935 [Peribacillus frigoritolerans]
MAKKDTAKQIQVFGPKDSYSLAEVYRFPRDGRKKAIDIVRGQILTVGKDADITETEAQRLLNNQTWEVKEVSE